VCRLRDLPEGAGACFEVNGEEIALFRLGGEVLALENACPHRGGALAFGEVRGGVVHCPLHAWGFDLRTGASDEYPGVAVRTFPVRLEGDEVVVEL
jgi:nitrite reductase (NADH) small subunit